MSAENAHNSRRFGTFRVRRRWRVLSETLRCFVGNHQRKKQSAAEFNAKRTEEIERIKREREVYEAWAKTPEGRAAIYNQRRRPSIIAYAAMAMGGFL